MANTIFQKDIIKEVAAQTGQSGKDTEAAVKALLDIIGKNLKKVDVVQFTGFGSFKATNKPAREGRNPSNGEKITIPARREVRFAVGGDLKKKVNS